MKTEIKVGKVKIGNSEGNWRTLVFHHLLSPLLEYKTHSEVRDQHTVSPIETMRVQNRTNTLRRVALRTSFGMKTEFIQMYKQTRTVYLNSV